MNSPGSRRVRPIKRACVDCHARKVRCDGAVNGFPCSNCKSAHVDCTVAERRKRKGAPVPESSHAVHEASRTDQHHQESPLDRRSGEMFTGPKAVPNSQYASPECNDEEEDDHCESEPGSGREAEYDGERELAKQHLVDFFSQDLQGNPIRARSTYVGSELANLNYLTRQGAANQHVYHYPCSNIYVPREFRSTQTLATPNLISKDAFVLPPKHVSDALVADYFTHVHPIFPIIDRERFLGLYHDSNASPSILILHSVCLAGSHVTKAYRNNQDLKVAFFRRAKALLDGRYEEDRMHVVQAALLLTWFSDGGDDICANAWLWTGMAARTAIGLGMHREVGPSKMPESDKRLWRMIWWCLVQFDCLVSLSHGRPQNINLDDCDVPPLQLDDFDASISEKDANSVIHHTKLCAIISDLVRSQFSVKAIKLGISRSDAIEAVDNALAEWLLSLPPSLRDKSTGETGNHSLLMMHLTYNTALIQFHRSLFDVRDEDAGAETAGDREICAEAASNIIRIFDWLCHNSGLRHCFFWASNSLFTAMLEINGQLRRSNPILALRCKEKYESGISSLRRLTRYWLFATSVLRLFESNSMKAAHDRADMLSSSLSAEQVSPDQESPFTRMAPAGSHLNSTGQLIGLNADSSQQNTMDWIQCLSFGDPNAGNMNVERNRWQHSIEEWQSLYWSDPLDNIRLEDNFGQFQYDWHPE